MKIKFIIFLVYLVFGLYFINTGLSFITLPEFFTSFDKWIILIGGVLIIIGSFNYLRTGKKSKGLIFQ